MCSRDVINEKFKKYSQNHKNFRALKFAAIATLCMYIHECIHVYIRTYVHNTDTYTRMYNYMHACMYVCMCVCTYSTFACMHVAICNYVIEP